MPFGNRPEGRGPRAGRQAGYCSGSGEPGYATAPGRRPGHGGGRGFGRRLAIGRQARRQAGRPR